MNVSSNFAISVCSMLGLNSGVAMNCSNRFVRAGLGGVACCSLGVIICCNFGSHSGSTSVYVVVCLSIMSGFILGNNCLLLSG